MNAYISPYEADNPGGAMRGRGRIYLTAHEARVVDDALTKFLNWEAVSDEDVEDDHAAQRVIDKLARLPEPHVECPNCGEPRHMYWGGSWCASCGWHTRYQTTQHADYAPDPECQWCNPATHDSGTEGH